MKFATPKSLEDMTVTELDHAIEEAGARGDGDAVAAVRAERARRALAESHLNEMEDLIDHDLR